MAASAAGGSEPVAGEKEGLNFERQFTMQQFDDESEVLDNISAGI